MNTEITELEGERKRGTIQKKPSISNASWVSCLLLLASAWFTSSIQILMPPWAFMWTVALVIFAGCKWLTWRRACRFVKSRRHDENQVDSTWIRAGYLLAWVGMDAEAFLRIGRPIAKPFKAQWFSAWAKVGFGAALLWVTVRLIPADAELLRGWIGLISLVFLLHFGLFHLLALVWQRAGVDAMPIMHAPILATSVADFWGRRWNLAFHQLAHEMVFRPLRRKLGVPLAAIAVFVVSGLVHESVISWPARGGYGGPLLYFALQALAVLSERIWRPNGWRARFWTVLCVAGPVGFLFHPPFINQVILPFMKVIGAF